MFPTVKITKGLLADHLIKTCKSVSLEYGLPKEIMYNVATDVISEKFQEFCKKLKVHHVVSLLNSH